MRRILRKRSQAEQLDLYTRVTLYVLPWSFMAGFLVPITLSLDREPGAVALGQSLLVLGVAQCAVAMDTMRRALAHYLDAAPVPRLSAGISLALGVCVTGLAVALQASGAVGDGAVLAQMLPFALVPTALSVYMLSTVRRLLLWTVLVVAVLGGAIVAVGEDTGLAVGCAVAVLIMALVALLAARPTAWFLSLIWELDRARGAQARLAVAEERLRFGRDMHDVMGRNLAVIALKSELAVQLARRGKPEAVDQMAEVQRIAQEAQREIRDVVRGYREADLRAELEGARGVLRAAGIDCRVSGDEGTQHLPPAVQSALGWVVREAATNVLRHGDANICVISLAATDEVATLVVENDGVAVVAEAEGAGGSGSAGGAGASRGAGLAGLGERLAALDGTLNAGVRDGDRFRLTAEVPLGRDAGGAGDSGEVRDAGDVPVEQRVARAREMAPDAQASGTRGTLPDAQASESREVPAELRASDVPETAPDTQAPMSRGVPR
ncbi:histidine kinase [Streptomyces sp. H27-C3]|uniref:sensor histidine kinase n=1 Tax=Streptomyces sp. H27-C3 TaxID=3046305 RepID=UPI0024B883A0|nr:histidine kinase [Streptomyces sp. H27-C3]MDJ0463502.1 histidine kinase [Streptomyces sp. H27-C3]